MDHIAIDLGGRESQICVRSQDGSIIDERRCATGTLSRYLQRRPAGRVVVETCAEAFSVADEAVAAGHEVKVVPATLVRVLGVGSRGVKTDRRDAQILSEVSCRIELPSVHVPAAITRDRRSQCTSRENLVQTRTSLINGARGWLRQQRVRIRSGTTQTFPKRVREKLLKSEAGLPAYIERMLVSIETLSEQIRAADGELQQLAREDSACERLMSVPGVGPVTAVRFVSALENVERFGGAHAVEAYLGLTPGERSSSDKKQRTGITKAGPAPVRRALVQACWVFRRLRPEDPLVQWCLEIEKRRGRKIAIIALARRLSGVLYALWRDGTRYDPEHRAVGAK